ncbi:hypothetical protein Mapa_001692 [Marchantia paleacea]|nr:hypothetical protein Mapa_001692 [Marchantia paleacea]
MRGLPDGGKLRSLDSGSDFGSGRRKRIKMSWELLEMRKCWSGVVCLLFLVWSVAGVVGGGGFAVEDDDGDRKLEGTIAFGTVGRSRYGFDVFAVSLPQIPESGRPGDRKLSDGLAEKRLTDGVSVNYNGQLVEGKEKQNLLQWLKSSGRVSDVDLREDDLAGNTGELMLYVSERDGSARVYISLFLDQGKNRGGSSFDLEAGPEVELLTEVEGFSVGSKREERKNLRYLSEIETSRRVLQFNVSKLGSSGPHLHDRPQLGGTRIVYVSTEQEREDKRQSWTGVYSTSLDSRFDIRLTPEGVTDFSPAISPSGEWVVAASLQGKGWQGEVHELDTDLYLFSAKDGSNRHLVTKNGGWPTWKDESTIFFHRQADDGWWSIFKLTLPEDFSKNGFTEGEIQEERVTPPGVHAFTPSASKAGDWIAVATRRPESAYRHIEIYDLSSKVFIRLTERLAPRAHHYNPSVSSSSKHVVYHRCKGVVGASTTPFAVPRLEPLQSPVPRVSLYRVDGTFPSFSRDGSLIAYLAQGVYVTNLNGKSRWQVYNGTAFATCWDRKRKGVIYISAGKGFSPELAEVHILSIFNADGEGEPYHKQLTKDGSGNNAFPSASPDGKYVVFRSGRTGYKNLYIMDAVDGEEGELRQLTSGPWTDTMANWSPTGEWIAFASNRESPAAGHFSVYLIHPDGTGLHKVLSDGGRANHPIFSPDGKSLVFTSDFAAISAEPVSLPNQFQPYGEIYIAKIDGSKATRLTHNSYEDGTPAWGPIFLDPNDLSEDAEDQSSCDFDDALWLTSPTLGTMC